MRSVLIAMVAALSLMACAPPQPTSNYDSCAGQAACLGTTRCTFSDAGASGTCLPPCTRDEDCPAPEPAVIDRTGARLRGLCGTTSRLCELLCDTNVAPECPRGMQCVRDRPSDSGGHCVWP
ncbi:MAG: hypothetical protein U0269_30660 [Polyangiales bacterium]